MTAKKRAIEFISSLPDELSEAEIQEYWLTHQRIQEGIKSLKAQSVKIWISPLSSVPRSLSTKNLTAEKLGIRSM